eukprot:251103_1
MRIHVVVVLIAIIVNVSYWSAIITAFQGAVNTELDNITWEGEEEAIPDMDIYVALANVLGIILTILELVGMFFSQSVFFLFLAIWIELNSIFLFLLSIKYLQSFLMGIIFLCISGVLSGPAISAYEYSKAIRKRYRERVINK